MGEGRQRLRPFLERILNEGQVRGVVWLNEEKTKFQIPWKHGGKQSWSEDDGQIFKEYAKMMSGGQIEDWDKSCCKEWKHKMRCALNKSGGPFIYLKEESTPDVRVYQLKTAKTRSTGDSPENSPPVVTLQTDITYPADVTYTNGETMVFANDDSMMAATMATTMATMGGACNVLPTTVESLNMNTGLSIENNSFNKLYDPDFKTPSSLTANKSSMEIYMGPSQAPQEPAPQTVPILPAGPAPDNYPFSFEALRALEAASPNPEHDIYVTLAYSRTRTETKKINSPYGVRICYNSSQRCQNAITTGCHEQLYGPELATVVEFDQSQPILDDTFRPMCNDLLDNICRGIVITNENGNLYAQRMSKAHVFFASATGTNGKSIKLSRDKKPTLIFDYENHFLAAMNRTQSVPDIEVHLQFGQSSDLDDTNPNNCLLSAVLVSGKAKAFLENPQATQHAAECSMQMSTSNEFDKIDQFMGASQTVKVEATVPVPEFHPFLQVGPETMEYLTMDSPHDLAVGANVCVRSEVSAEDRLVDEAANLSLDDTSLNSGESFNSCQSTLEENTKDKAK